MTSLNVVFNEPNFLRTICFTKVYFTVGTWNTVNAFRFILRWKEISKLKDLNTFPTGNESIHHNIEFVFETEVSDHDKSFSIELKYRG